MLKIPKKQRNKGTWEQLILFLCFFVSLFLVVTAPAQAVETVSLPNPLGTGADAADPKVIIARIILGITGAAGSIALLIFIYGGFQWLTSAGNPEKIKKGRDILLWSALGLLVMFGSFIVVRYILNAITKGTITP